MSSKWRCKATFLASLSHNTSHSFFLSNRVYKYCYCFLLNERTCKVVTCPSWIMWPLNLIMFLVDTIDVLMEYVSLITVEFKLEKLYIYCEFEIKSNKIKLHVWGKHKVEHLKRQIKMYVEPRNHMWHHN